VFSACVRVRVRVRMKEKTKNKKQEIAKMSLLPESSFSKSWSVGDKSRTRFESFPDML
jgi:hypothetical protein